MMALVWVLLSPRVPLWVTRAECIAPRSLVYIYLRSGYVPQQVAISLEVVFVTLLGYRCTSWWFIARVWWRYSYYYYGY